LASTNDAALADRQGATGAPELISASTPVQDWEDLQRDLARCLEERRCWGRRIARRDATTGQQRQLALRYVFEPPESVLLIAEDVTAQFEAELALQLATESAEAARRQERERWLEAERRRQIAESLRDILAALNSDQPVEEILSLIAAQASQLLGTQAVGVYRLESDPDRWAVEVSKGLLVTYVAGANVPIGQDTLRRAMVARRPMVGPPVLAAAGAEDDRVSGADARPPVSPWVGWYRAWLAVPIITKGETYGGMLLYYTESRVLSEEEIQLATAFSDQAALAIENARLRARVQQAAALAERERLARELHDAVTQTLFAASVIAEALPRIWEAYPEERQRGIEELRTLTRGALAEMRTMLIELRPAALTEKPLGELLSHLGDAMSGRNRIPVAVNVEGDTALQPDLQVALYRIAQEALTNIAKHAAASQASVTLHCMPGSVELRVTDDGRGFDPSNLRPGRSGLRNMRDRAADVGAVLEIETEPGEGTQVLVLWEGHPEE
jgi:signal transduction histidine kinase